MFNDLKDVRVLTRMALSLALLIVGGYIAVPMPGTPTSVSLVTFVLCLIGLLFPPKQTLTIILAYLLLAAIGLPVLTGGAGGAAHFVGPTAGYLLAFPIAYTLLSIFKGSKPSFPSYAIRAVLITSTIVSVLGAWGFVTFAKMDWSAAWATALPFVPGDIIKATVAAFIASQLATNTRLFKPQA